MSCSGTPLSRIMRAMYWSVTQESVRSMPQSCTLLALTGNMPKKPNPSTNRAQQIKASCPDGNFVTCTGWTFASDRRSGVVSRLSMSAFRVADIMAEVVDEPVFNITDSLYTSWNQRSVYRSRPVSMLSLTSARPCMLWAS